MASVATEYSHAFSFENFEVLLSTNRTPCDPIATFDFEKNFECEDKIYWFQKNWSKSIVVSALYVILIFSGRLYMENRPKFDLRAWLILWSSCLALFSWVGSIRVWTSTIHFVRTYGLKASACDPIFYQGVAGFWSWLFVLSKLPELGDTLFIVLRKQKLIFLHWYHHITVLIYCWYTYPQLVAPSRYFVLMNFSVHSLMYTYYAFKASRIINIPYWINIFITAMQIGQMFVGCVVNGYAFFVRRNGGFCSTTDENLRASFLIYLSYLGLFVVFFYENYVISKRKQPMSTSTLRDANENMSNHDANKAFKSD